jgi:DNA-binding NtrC family response regulator
VAAGFATKLTQGTSPIDVLLRDMVRQTRGAEGAIVFALGLGADGAVSVAPVPAPSPEPESPVVRPYRVVAREFDRKVFTQALAATGGNVREAARILRIPLSTFRYRAGKIGVLAAARRKRARKSS